MIKQINCTNSFTNIESVGALDVAYKDKYGYVAAVIYKLESEEIIEVVSIKEKVKTPYIPTFLFLREVPCFLKIISELQNKPDVYLIDGHGLAHPYFTGSATVFGILSNFPSIGIAKKPLRYFKYETIDEITEYIIVKEKKVGIKYKTKEIWNPLYISPGNNISLDSAFQLVKSLILPRFKLPYPLHLAHQKAEEAKTVL